MSQIERIRRQQVLREAEGYLDLLMMFADRWPVEQAIRDRVVLRVLTILRELPRLGGHRAEVLYLRGQALRAAERYAAAVVPLREASALEPGNLHTWMALGWCYKRTGRLDLAIEALEEGLAIAPDEAILHYNLACYWALASNARLAVEYLGRAFDIDSNFRDQAPLEPDFDSIRNDPEFQAMLGAGV